MIGIKWSYRYIKKSDKDRLLPSRYFWRLHVRKFNWLTCVDEMVYGRLALRLRKKVLNCFCSRRAICISWFAVAIDSKLLSAILTTVPLSPCKR